MGRQGQLSTWGMCLWSSREAADDDGGAEAALPEPMRAPGLQQQQQDRVVQRASRARPHACVRVERGGVTDDSPGRNPEADFP